MTSTVPRSVALVTNELRGFAPAGGLGTATTFLALGLARMGHHTEIVYFGGHSLHAIDATWARRYADAGVCIRAVPSRDVAVEPWHFGRMRDVELALRDVEPDVVVVQDLGAPAYAALRLRQLGIGFAGTTFVVYCHGTRRWVTDMSRRVGTQNVRDLLAVSVLEQASLELADVVVSPSAYLVGWMRAQGWRLPDRTLIIPYLTRSVATGEDAPIADAGDERPVRRVAFFGRLEEKKGLKLFAAGLNAVEPELLEGFEVEFIGKPTPTWPPQRVEALLSQRTRSAVRVAFETDLDLGDALARLSRPGTLAVIPSLADNSPNTVYECLERGIPFLASRAGGIPELVEHEDHVRVLFEPTPRAFESVLRQALGSGLAPARAAYDGHASLQRWTEVIAMQTQIEAPRAEAAEVDVIVVHRSSRGALSRCLRALVRQSHPVNVAVVLAGRDVPDVRDLEGSPRVVRAQRSSVECARETGLQATSSPWVLFLDEEDVPETTLVETLVQAQAAAMADVVTCGLRIERESEPATLHFFPGQPRGLGILSNGYGNIALLRRSLLRPMNAAWAAAGDPDWPLLATLSVSGARIVSVPAPLVTRRSVPGSIEQHPSDALLVVQQFERRLPHSLRSVARVAAGLAANSSESPGVASLRDRAREILRNRGLLELARRSLRRAVAAGGR